MKLTTNYSLKKPEGSDVVNIDDFNYNADIIDSAIQEAKGKIDINKGDILNLNNRADNLNAQIGNLISTDNILTSHGYVTRRHCNDANSLNLNNGIFVTDGDTIGVNEIGILDHKQWDVNYAYQTFHPHGRAYLRFRHKSGNAWTEWREL